MSGPGNPLESSGSPGREILKFFFCAQGLIILSDVPNQIGVLFHAARAVLAVLLVTSLVLPPRRGLLLLLLLAMAGQDIVGGGEDLGMEYVTASIWQFNFGPIRPSWVIFLCVSIQLLRCGRLAAPPMVKVLALWFATVPVVTGLFYGGFASPYAGKEVVVDLKFGFMLIGSLVLFLTILKDDLSALRTFLWAFVGALLARHLTDLFYYFFGIGPALVEGVTRVSEDSAKGGVIFLVFFGTMLVLRTGRWWLGAVISVFSILLLAVYGTRLLWITFLLGTLVLSSFMGVRRSISLVFTLVLLAVGGGWLFYKISPLTAEVILARSTSLTVGREIEKFAVDVPYNALSRIDPIRYGEGMNILETLERRFAYVWGLGYGGYYDDNAVYFPPTLKSSYPDYSLNSGKFFAAHLYSLQVLLKHGLLGLVVISALWWIPGIGLFRRLKESFRHHHHHDALLQGTVLCLLAFLPTAISQFYWSGKGLFINGAILAMSYELPRVLSDLAAAPSQDVSEA